MTAEQDSLRKVKDVADALRRAKERGDSASFLMGAGASVSAGIPLAHGFVEAIKRSFPAAYDRATAKTYPHVMRELDMGPRHDLIAHYVDQARLNWTHILLGVLVQRGYVGRILTTNFDNLSLRCTGLYGVYPAVYDVTALANFNASLIRDPAVLFLHGQHRGFVQLHSHDDVTKNARKLQPIFADATIRRPWIVLGYSGDSDPVFECLTRVSTFPYGLYWIGYRESPPSPAVSAKLLGKTRQAFLVPGYDADSFMIELFRELGLELPSMLTDPFTHSLDVLDQFVPFPTERGDQDFTASARMYLQNARRLLIEGGLPVPRSDTDAELSRLMMQGHLFRGDYDAVIALAGNGEVPPTLRSLVAVALAGRASAAREDVHRAVRHFHDPQVSLGTAIRDLDRAILLAPELAELYSERAAVRLTAFEGFTGDVANDLMAHARADLEHALRLQPDMLVALYNLAYGEALVAQREIGPARRMGLERALAGFRQALGRDEEHVMSLVNCARTLFALADEGHPNAVTEAEALLRRAQQIEPRNYELRLATLAYDMKGMATPWKNIEVVLPGLVARAEALCEADPEDIRGRFLFGLLQTIQAVFSEAPAARETFDNGWRAYAEARELPQLTRAMGDVRLDDLRKFMAAAAWMEADHRGEELGASYYRLAEKEFEAALPGDALETLKLWASVLTLRADGVENSLRIQLLDRAEDKLAAATAAAPDDPETMLEWAAAKMARAKAPDANAEACYNAAIELLRRAEAIAPGARIEFAWADSCKQYAEVLGDDARAFELLCEACIRFERGLADVSDEGEHWFGLTECAHGIASHCRGAGKIDDARLFYRKALSACLRISELETNPDILGMQASILMEMAELEEEQGDLGAATVLYRQAEELVEAALRRAPMDRDILELALDIHDELENVAGFAGILTRLARLNPPFTRTELGIEYDLLEDPQPPIREALALLPP